MRRQKTWQKKTAEGCQIVQKIAGQRIAKTLRKREKCGIFRVLALIPVELRVHDPIPWSMLGLQQWLRRMKSQNYA
jgi:hypothetical protein